MMKAISVRLAAVLLPAVVAVAGCAAPDDWGRVSVTREADAWNVILENRQLLARYGPAGTGVGTKDRITAFRLKKPDRLVATALDGRHADKGQAFFRMSDATVEADSPGRKTVRLVFDKRVEYVSILKGMPVIEINYDQGGHNLDYKIRGDTYVFHGQDAWQAKRGWDKAHPTLRDEYDPTGSYYRTGWEGRPLLSYNGWMIMGVYDSETGVGAGLLLPTMMVRWIKLVGWDRVWGFERWMAGRHRAYLYAVTGGGEEILSMGRKLADTVGKSR